ncbi:glycosyltransferase family 2 protein [Butyrivibrio sp. AD3002]|uniref:glycosyltransferase family 2 protein n=1 Tax=Butyrivibrio sp. AD3002 TaxID=1280670 RepID=UPI0003B61226|nr:glycosyltransferase family 2 protein [Butyrivibrio sp. AD3002]
MDIGKVSIIVPIYNQERYLDKSIRSIIEQTYKNIEIVAVNDGSTDKSRNMLEEYQKDESRLVIINKENGGLIDAVSEGVRNATGDYLAFVDPDDYIGRNFIEDLMDLFDSEVDIVAAGMYAEELSEEITKSKRTIFLDKDEKYTGDKLQKLREEFFWDKKRAVNISPIFQSRCNKVYRKSIVDKIIDEYQSHKEAVVGEDTIFNYLALQYTKGVRAQREPVQYYYCLRQEASMTRDNDHVIRYTKNRNTLHAFKEILEKHNDTMDMAYELFYLQMQVVLYQASQYSNKYKELQNNLRFGNEYREAYQSIIQNAIGIKKKYLRIKCFIETSAPIGIAFGIRNVRTIAGKIKNRSWKERNK